MFTQKGKGQLKITSFSGITKGCLCTNEIMNGLSLKCDSNGVYLI